jgi:hypothetical protein
MGTDALGSDGLSAADELRPQRLRWIAILVYTASMLVSVGFWLWVLLYAARLLLQLGR